MNKYLAFVGTNSVRGSQGICHGGICAPDEQKSLNLACRMPLMAVQIMLAFRAGSLLLAFALAYASSRCLSRYKAP